MTELQALSAKLSAHGVNLIGLNVDTEADADVKGFPARQSVTYPILIGGVQTVEQLYATDDMAVPLSILIDDHGVVTELIRGWSAQTRRRFVVLAGAGDGAPASRTKPN